MKNMFIRCLIVLILTVIALLTTEIFMTPLSHAATLTSTMSHNGPYGPDTCLNGYVWRDAFSGDHVCVTPEQRTQAAYDNSQAPYRIKLDGGPYGPTPVVMVMCGARHLQMTTSVLHPNSAPRLHMIIVRRSIATNDFIKQKNIIRI